MPVTLTRGSFVERLLRRAFRAAFRLEPPPLSAREPSPTIPVLEDPEALIPGLWNRTITLGRCGWRWGHPSNDNELILLCALVAAGFTPVVEFGTFDGRTTYNLALNSDGDATITTIDLPGADDGSNIEQRTYGAYVSGACLLDAPPALRARVRQIQADSRTVDLSLLYSQVGLVFIDGGHSEAVCRHDTETALRLVRPGGIVAWDDYTPYWPGVKTVVDEVSRQLPLHHLPRFGLVLYQRPR